MDRKPTYEELELRVRELEKELRDTRRAEEMLRDAEDIKQLLKFAPFGVCLTDLSGKIVACNERGAEHLGKTVEKSIGTVLREYFPAEVAENKRLKGMEAIQLRQAVTFEDQTEGKWYSNSISPIFDEEGKPVRLAIYGADVTEYKNALDALEKSEEKYRQLSELLPQVVFETDEKGNLTFTNRMAFDFFGYTRPDFEKGLNALQMLIPDDRERAVANIQMALRGEKSGGTEYTALTKDGRTYPVMLYSNPVMREGKPVGLRGIIVDLTEVKRAEEALRESEERWQFALEGSRDGVWDWNVVTNEVFFSKRWKEMLGYNDDEISNHLDEWDKRVHPDDKERCYADLNKHFNGEVPYYENEHRVLCKDGSYKWILDRGKVISWTETNKPQRVIGTHTDITERKHVEEELRESQELLENILKASAVGIAYARDRKIIWANQAMTRMFQFTQEDHYIGQDTNMLYVDEAEYKRVGRLIYEQQKSGKVTELDVKFKRRDDSLFDGYVKVNILDPLDPMKGIIVSIFDITDRKRAEEEREKLQAQLSNAVEMAHLGPWEYDVVNDIFIFNDYFYKIFHTTAEQVGGYTMSSTDYARRFLYPEDIPVVREEVRKAIKTTEINFSRQLEHRILHADGTVGYVTVRFFIVKGANGQAVNAYGVAQNITERKRAEEALRESEEKYRLLIENATDAIFIAQDKVVKFANPKAEKMTGYPAAQLAKIPFVDFVHPEDRDMVLERHLKRLNGQEPLSIYSFRIVNRSGEVLSVELNAVLINWEGRPATLNFLRDITAQKKLEAQLQQAQKMEALGTLAGGIAHDFNNLLMAIQGRASIMLMNKDSSHPDFEHLRGIEGHVESAADLTGQLLGFARGGKYEVKPIDINGLIKTGSRMFGRTKKEIQIHGKYQKDVWTIEADRSQIEQVLMNLYVNAWQAMPSGGKLYLQTENVRLDENYVKPFETEPGRYVKISVTDTGVGMDEVTRQRIFDPFFTTKEMGRGTGLGLASAYGIIKNHGGFINVYSEKDEGTTFNFYLPASEKEVIEENELPEDLLKGSETVLYVDDEEMIIEIGEQLLQKLGYEVFVARSGKKATEIYEKNKDKIDIVILDMIMPDMSGGDTYDRMKEIDPDIKVLLSSGYSINGHATEILDRGCNGFIQKPFKMKELSQKLREILDKK